MNPNLPAWFGKKREDQNARSKKQEKNRAKEIGGKVQAGSGSSWRARQDVKSEEFLEELKYTDRSTYALDARNLRSLLTNATNLGRTPRFVIEFTKFRIRAIITIERIQSSRH